MKAFAIFLMILIPSFLISQINTNVLNSNIASVEFIQDTILLNIDIQYLEKNNIPKHFTFDSLELSRKKFMLIKEEKIPVYKADFVYGVFDESRSEQYQNSRKQKRAMIITSGFAMAIGGALSTYGIFYVDFIQDPIWVIIGGSILVCAPLLLLCSVFENIGMRKKITKATNTFNKNKGDRILSIKASSTSIGLFFEF